MSEHHRLDLVRWFADITCPYGYRHLHRLLYLPEDLAHNPRSRHSTESSVLVLPSPSHVCI